MGGDGTISQSELDALFGNRVDDLQPVDDNSVSINKSHIWIIKNLTTGGTCGGIYRNPQAAQSALAYARKCYPDFNLEIKQAR